ncbi:RNase J family beta-CASP ribonuclease [Candidatus Aerophobetes bacterium]|uniref:RNase J family beta-CASP ribonuclease n=1 Tax=Aerophobetes bacterium TaxID=2030807 RepID=A0A662D7E9_UNCAE|nr:MAG: RNase J family beta-CASP ribonuclease [Candidatus Aerophobetes bacterium]
MTNLTFYGGVGEVGGNKILLETKESRVFFDFGMSFKKAGLYFSEFLQPRKCNGIGDFLEFGLIPDLAGLYRRDYLRHMGRKEEEREYDGVFLTHAHADHISYVNHLRDDITIYGSEITRGIMQALEDTGSSGFSDFVHLKVNFELEEKKGGEGLKKKRGHRIKRDFYVIEKEVKINDIKVTALPVDHSLPGALGYIVETPEGYIVYTGDLRFHGYHGELTRKFIEAAAKRNPRALITEGTRIKEKDGFSEEELQERIYDVVKKTNGLVVVNFPVRDIDRMNSFFRVAQRAGRRLVINTKQAYLLDILSRTSCNCPSLNDVGIYLQRKRWGLIGRSDYPDKIVEEDYFTWERKFINHPSALTYKDIRDNPDYFIFRCDFFELKELIDIKPPRGSCYIRSVTEPFDEEMEIEKKRADNWLRHFGLYPYKQIHCSGHANGEEIEQIVKEISPQILIPIHTEHPHLFRKFYSNTKIVTEGETVSLP